MNVKEEILLILDKYGIERNESTSLLIDIVGVDEADVKKEQLRRRICAIQDKIDFSNTNTPVELISVLKNELSKIENYALDLFAKKNEPLYSFLEKKYKSDRDLEVTNGQKGYRLNHYTTLATAFDGVKPAWYLIGAEPNVGKTVFLMSLTTDILKTHKGYVPTFFLTFDDSIEEIINGIVASWVKLPRTVIDRKRDIRYKQREEDIKKAYEILAHLAKEGLFNVLSFESIETFDQVETFIRTQKEKNPRSVFIIDAINNLSGMENENHRITHVNRANAILRWVKEYKVPIFATHELRKLEKGKRPTTKDFIESGKYAYNSQVCILLSSEDEDSFKKKENMIVNFDIAKNKNTGHKGVIKQWFNTAEAYFDDASNTEIKKIERITEN